MSIRGYVRAAVLTAIAFTVSVAGAAAQTTVILSDPGTEVTGTTIQAGAGANTNFSALDSIATSTGTTPDDLRHALLKFDTQNTMPAGMHVVSATLSLTLKSGGSDASRTVRLFPVTNSFIESEATWMTRRAGYAWTTAGGDFGPLAVSQTVSNVAGAKISIDVTALVQAAVSGGASTSRYTRIGFVDGGASSAGSIRRFYSSRALDPSVRPLLTVAYSGDAPSPVTAAAASPTATLRVLQYNTHHGGWGTDGVYNPSRIVSWIVKANPDVVSLNEVEVGTSWSKGADLTTLYQSLLQKATGRSWYKVFLNHAGWATGNGNLILSKYPFIATAKHLLTAERSVVDITISVNGRTINVASTHLDTSSGNRAAEMSELLQWETSLAEQRLILGDFNFWPTSSDIATMKSTYTDVWATAQSLGTAVGNGITHRAHRIDYIFQSKKATYLSVASVQILNTADAKGVKPSDHDPVLAVFRVK